MQTTLSTASTETATYLLFYGPIHAGQWGKRRAPWQRVLTPAQAAHWRQHGYSVTLKP